MAVVANDVSGSSNDGTIDELVIVRVGGNEVETVGRIDALHIWSLHQLLQHGVGDDKVIALGQYFVVLIQYLVGDAECVFAGTESLLDVVVVRPWHDDVDEAVGVEDYLHK